MENITKNALVHYLGRAQELLDFYGYARTHSEQGLMPYVAVGLTALPAQSIPTVATTVALKGSAGGVAAFPDAYKLYAPLYEGRIRDMRVALVRHVGPECVLVHSATGIRDILNELG